MSGENDCDAFVCRATGLSEQTVGGILLSKGRYLIGMGIVPGYEDVVNAAGRRSAHPDLFPAEHMATRTVMPALERAFIERDTGFDAVDIYAVLTAEMQWMRDRGMVDDLAPRKAD